MLSEFLLSEMNRLGAQDALPLHRQLYEALRRAMLDGKLGAGERLSSSRDLAQDLGLSRNTVVAAINQLSVEGYLVSRVGSGTFVADSLTRANSDILRENNQLAANYFATLRANNDTADGIPRDLINDDNFTGTAADVQGNGVTIRYVIERQCANAGPFDASTCSVFPKPAASSGGERRELVGAEYAPIYRITVRVQGPRNTTAFLQSLITI